MASILIGVVLLILLFGGMGYAVYYQIQKTNPANGDTSVKKDIETAQEFLPFEEIKDSMVNLGNHQYRAYIEVSSINYNLKTDKEKNIIEATFQRFLNSLTFPISIFVHTKTMDNTRQMQSLEQDIQETLKEYPNLGSYAEVYYQEMGQIYERIDNTKQKKKYIIVPFDDALTLTNSTDKEKYEYVLKEMYTRCSMVRDSLASMGIETNILTTPEILEMATSVYHRTNYMHVDGVIDGAFTSLIVEGNNEASEKTEEEKLDVILTEALKKIEVEVLGKRRFGISENGEYARKVLLDLKENKERKEEE
ncbi:hypothetical protein JMA_42380 (plasmid) [Jeotgalibacillus malaysiensis]|uniref:TraC-like domain-containing protein n=1 Tax=Jeotgalibacillus malaysiensis TaxID=1508404 RepID=A0A0B5ATL4_9BACL|nr:hypothetical protein [Jeotgalibacillus malaysiensis]AJD93555.1 hypothetical protein JMA_42380 [Jeotgalibacillus malaysiensis]